MTQTVESVGAALALLDYAERLSVDNKCATFYVGEYGNAATVAMVWGVLRDAVAAQLVRLPEWVQTGGIKDSQLWSKQTK